MTCSAKELAQKREASGEHRNPGIYFSDRRISLDGCKRYTVSITADDYYKLYINGHFAAMGPAPSYHFAYNYNTIDISEFIVDGENDIFVHTYYQGLCNRVFCSGDLRHGLWAELMCGSEPVCVTDEEWEYAYDMRFGSADTVGYDTQFLENINTYNSSREWRHALLKQYDDYTLRPQITETCKVEELRPECIVKTDTDSYLFDFGKEYSGWIRIYADAGNIGEVMLCYAEEAENGHARYNMRCAAGYREKWILNGIDDTEGYDYKAFRFVEIYGITNPACVSLIKRGYPVKSKQNLKTGNQKLDAILEICRQGVLTATQEVFMDCPTREKGQYLGDLTVTALAHSYITGDTAMYKKALFDFAASGFVCRGLMCCAPCSFMQEVADFSLLYPYQLYKYYELTHDRETVKQLFTAVEGMLDYFNAYRRDDGLLENVHEKWNLVDWPENLRDGYDFALTKPIGRGCHNVLNAYYYGGLKYAQRLAEIACVDIDFGAGQVLSAYRKAFFRNNTCLFADSELSDHPSLHSNALPLFFGMAEDTDAISRLIKKKGLSCGVFMSYFVLKGLTLNGYKEQALELILNESEHSWVNMLREGATCCFEAWGKDQKWNTSLCHPWAAAPIIVIKEDFPYLLEAPRF